jgi:energy-converting hydrogenase Eha subunit C
VFEPACHGHAMLLFASRFLDVAVVALILSALT